MLKTRLIPCVLLRNGSVVQSKGFCRYQLLGNPTTIVRRLSDWACDELIYLDISRHPNAALAGRRDLKERPRAGTLEIIADVARHCFMPLIVGGGIRSIDDAAARLIRGADKIAINTQAVRTPDFISDCAHRFGSQCVVVGIDAQRNPNGGWEVMADGGRIQTGLAPGEWARTAERFGAGEILIQSVDRDGAGTGFDIDLVRAVENAVAIPVIALGGAGDWSHFAEVIRETGVSAVAAANIFQYGEQTVHRAKRYLFDAGFNVRPPALFESDTILSAVQTCG